MVDDTQIKELETKIVKLQNALRPFTHPDLHKIFGGNCEGSKSVVFQRNNAVLRIGDFKRAFKTVKIVQDKI